MRTKIRHPKADTISIVDEWGILDRKEIAFFQKGECVLEPIEPFADYHDGADEMEYSTSVYRYVPIALIEAFLDENKA